MSEHDLSREAITRIVGKLGLRVREPEHERWCACTRPSPARAYLGRWACLCGAPIEPRKPWAP